MSPTLYVCLSFAISLINLTSGCRDGITPFTKFRFEDIEGTWDITGTEQDEDTCKRMRWEGFKRRGSFTVRISEKDGTQWKEVTGSGQLDDGTLTITMPGEGTRKFVILGGDKGFDTYLVGADCIVPTGHTNDGKFVLIRTGTSWETDEMIAEQIKTTYSLTLVESRRFPNEDCLGSPL